MILDLVYVCGTSFFLLSKLPLWQSRQIIFGINFQRNRPSEASGKRKNILYICYILRLFLLTLLYCVHQQRLGFLSSDIKFVKEIFHLRFFSTFSFLMFSNRLFQKQNVTPLFRLSIENSRGQSTSRWNSRGYTKIEEKHGFPRGGGQCKKMENSSKGHGKFDKFTYFCLISFFLVYLVALVQECVSSNHQCSPPY